MRVLSKKDLSEAEKLREGVFSKKAYDRARGYSSKLFASVNNLFENLE